MEKQGNREDKFEYSYSAPTEEERREINSIRRQYIPKDDGDRKLQRLRAIDKKVKVPAVCASLFSGLFGCIVFGGGFAMILKLEMLLWGSVISLSGCAIMGSAYPIYRGILSRNKKKYGGEILKIADDLLNKREN